MFVVRRKRKPPLVLRTVFLPQDVDERLKELASQRGCSKNDLIRGAVISFLDEQDGKRG